MVLSRYKKSSSWDKLTKEQKLTSLLCQEKNRSKLEITKTKIDVRVLRSQVQGDRNLKETFKEMFPGEFEKALEETHKRYGKTLRKPARRTRKAARCRRGRASL